MGERELKKILKNNGYYEVKSGSGNHSKFKKCGVERIVTINSGKKTNCMVVKRLIKQIKEDCGL